MRVFFSPSCSGPRHTTCASIIPSHSETVRTTHVLTLLVSEFKFHCYRKNVTGSFSIRVFRQTHKLVASKKQTSQRTHETSENVRGFASFIAPRNLRASPKNMCFDIHETSVVRLVARAFPVKPFRFGCVCDPKTLTHALTTRRLFRVRFFFYTVTLPISNTQRENAFHSKSARAALRAL